MVKAVTFLIVVYYTYKIIKGKHRTPKCNTPPVDIQTNTSSRTDASIATTVHVHNSIQFDAVNATPRSESAESKPKTHTGDINRGPSFALSEFTENSIVDVWLT